MSKRRTRIEQAAQNREALLAAARGVFLDRGYHGATLDAIAETAGFSKGVVYSQFESKADLFLCLLDRRIEERAQENRTAIAGKTGGEAVLALMKAGESDAARNPGWALLLIEFRSAAARDPAVNARYAACHRRTIDGLVSVFSDVWARSPAAPALAPETMAEFVLALGAGLTLERCVEPDALPPGKMAPHLLRMLGLEPAAHLPGGDAT